MIFVDYRRKYDSEIQATPPKQTGNWNEYLDTRLKGS
jgi:hypothetical protein